MAEIVSESDLARLRTVLRHLETISEALPDDMGLSLGNAALSDTKDWLDCFIERLVAATSRPSSQPLMGDREKIESAGIWESLPDGGLGSSRLAAFEAGKRAATDAILASLPAQGGERHWRDKDDQWTEAIDAAHPVKSTHPERHKLYERAMEMVGNRRGKGALVNLVSWLLQQAHPVPEQDGWREPTPELLAEFANIDGPWTRGQLDCTQVWQSLYDAQAAGLRPQPEQEAV